MLAKAVTVLVQITRWKNRLSFLVRGTVKSHYKGHVYKVGKNLQYWFITYHIDNYLKKMNHYLLSLAWITGYEFICYFLSMTIFLCTLNEKYSHFPFFSDYQAICLGLGTMWFTKMNNKGAQTQEAHEGNYNMKGRAEKNRKEVERTRQKVLL